MKIRFFITLLSLLLLTSCKQKVAFCGAPSEANQLQSESIASEELTRDALEALKNHEIAQGLLGEKGTSSTLPTVVSKVLVTPPTVEEGIVSTPWSEDWVVQREGYTVLYHITFLPCQTGGTYISIKYPPEHTAESQEDFYNR